MLIDANGNATTPEGESARAQYCSPYRSAVLARARKRVRSQLKELTKNRKRLMKEEQRLERLLLSYAHTTKN